jgi:hypothetical protein
MAPKCTVEMGRLEVQFQEAESICPVKSVGTADRYFIYKIGRKSMQLAANVAHLCKQAL